MNDFDADALAARQHLARRGWIARRAESFRHLPPPGATVWLGEDESVIDREAAASDGWILHGASGAFGDGVDVRWFDAADPAQRTALFSDLPVPGDEDAAPFAWAHRALVREAVRLRIAPSTKPVMLSIERRAARAVEAPLLLVELLPGAQAVLLETHTAHGSQPVVQNAQVHVRLAPGAQLQHLRRVLPAPGDRVAHQVRVQLARDAHYAQSLLASGAGYHLQRNVLDLQEEGAAARLGGVLLASGSALEQQVLARHGAARTRSETEVLALASGPARVVVNAHTHIAPGCDDAQTRQKLVGVPTGGQPRIVLRPHLEIHHDQVQAAHGATWGALPDDALFHARQRGLDERSAKALILGGLAQSVHARAVDSASVPQAWCLDAAVASAVTRHLEAEEMDHG
jgi:Fe-S cluster assembly protein SufD